MENLLSKVGPSYFQLFALAIHSAAKCTLSINVYLLQALRISINVRSILRDVVDELHILSGQRTCHLQHIMHLQRRIAMLDRAQQTKTVALFANIVCLETCVRLVQASKNKAAA